MMKLVDKNVSNGSVATINPIISNNSLVAFLIVILVFAHFITEGCCPTNVSK